MYHWIVRKKMENVFLKLNSGNLEYMINQFADTFIYRFVGQSPLSGTRNSTKSMKLWWKRVYTLFPNAHFELHEIVSSGMPWKTKVMTYLTISDNIPLGPTIFISCIRMNLCN